MKPLSTAVWSAVATANAFRGMVGSPELSHIAFEDLVDEVGMMVADVSKHHDEAVKVTNADEILHARAQGKVGILPTVEHLAIGDVLHRVDVLYSLGVRMAGITYNLQNSIGSGTHRAARLRAFQLWHRSGTPDE